MKNTHHCETWQRDAVAVAVASCFVLSNPLYANPIGPSIANGVVSIAQQVNSLNITNSPGAIINWQSFSIGVSEATRFIQQSAASSVLNRVTGVDPSSILGALQSNGRVFLINPNGVLFGAGAQVDVAGLVVSTLNLSNADFLNGRYNFTANAGTGGISNQGNLTALPGGQIYLVAPNISNSGMITSANGDIILAAGNSVELVNANSPDVRVVIDAPSNEVLNLGSIVANSGRVGIYAGLINHHGIVSADTATVDATGKVVFMASKDINLEPGSVVSASGTAGGVHDGGEVRLIADGTLAMRHGAQVHVDGGVDGGNGGFLELSGLTGLSLRGIYSGRAHKAGFRNGSLLLDPLNINITSGGSDGSGSLSASGQISASASSSASFNVDPTSLNNGGWADISLAALNNITVSSPISNADINNGTAGGSLTLTAGNHITISAPIGASGARFNHDLTLTADNNVNIYDSIYLGNNTLTLTADADTNGSGNVLVAPAGNNNSVIVDTLGDIFINAASLTVSGGSASASPDWGPHHADATLHAGGILDITTANGVTVQGGTASASANSSWVGSSAQVNASANAELSATGALIIRNGNVTVQGGNAQANVSASDATVTATANALLSGGSVEIINGGSVSVRGGDGASASGQSGSAARGVATANANAELSATGLLTINASNLLIQGGSNGVHASAGSSGSATATANALLSGGTVNITTTAGGVQVRGGDLCGDCSSSARARDGGEASISVNGELSATGLLTIHAASDVIVAGGSGSSTQAYANNGGSATAEMNALMTAATIDITTTGGGTVQVLGGSGSSGQARAYGSGVANVAANAELSATGLLTIHAAGDVIVAGGSNGGGWQGRALAGGGGSASAAVSALLHAATIDITTTSGSVQVLGGSSARAYVSGSGVATTTDNAELSATGGLTITTTAGGLTVAGGNNARAVVSSGGSAVATTNANAKLAAGGDMTLNISGDIAVNGGSSATASARGWGGNNTAIAHADGEATAGGLLTMNAASLTIQGGNAAFASASDNGVNTGTATGNATMQAGSLDITLDGLLTVRGGGATGSIESRNSPSARVYHGSSSGLNTATIEANALLHADGNASVTVNSGDVTISGGSNASASVSASVHGTAIAKDSANAELSAGGNLNLTVSNGILTVRGGDGASADVSSAASNNARLTATAEANAKLAAVGGMTLNVSGDIMVRGGDNASADAYGSTAGNINTATAHADALLSAGSLLAMNAANLTIQGGNNTLVDASDSGANTAVATANATVQAGSMGITLTGALLVQGGRNANASANCLSNCVSNTATANADALLSATGVLTIYQASGLTVQAGDGVGAMTSNSGDNIATVSANATVSGGTVNITTSGALQIRGGMGTYTSSGTSSGSPWYNSGGFAQAGGVSSIVLTNANALLVSTGALTVQAGSLTLQGGSAQATGSGGALPFGNALANAGAGISVVGDANITVTAGDMLLGGGTATANGTATVDASAILAVGGIKTLNLPAGSLRINGGTVSGTGGKAAQAVFDPGAINAIVAGDIMLTGGNALGAEAMMYSLGPVNLTVGGATGISLSGGASTGISPSYNTSTSPITITFTGGGMVQPFVITQGMADVMIQSLYVVPPVIVPPVVVPPASVPTGDLLQQALNSVLDGALETEALPILNDPLLAAVEQSGEEENPLEKKPTYTCQ